jgi:hypothetical protein
LRSRPSGVCLPPALLLRPAPRILPLPCRRAPSQQPGPADTRAARRDHRRPDARHLPTPDPTDGPAANPISAIFTAPPPGPRRGPSACCPRTRPADPGRLSRPERAAEPGQSSAVSSASSRDGDRVSVGPAPPETTVEMRAGQRRRSLPMPTGQSRRRPTARCP